MELVGLSGYSSLYIITILYYPPYLQLSLYNTTFFSSAWGVGIQSNEAKATPPPSPKPPPKCKIVN